ncbi:MAG: hypothetical protein QM731_03990 [Chitinophagaceae bacterium]
MSSGSKKYGIVILVILLIVFGVYRIVLYRRLIHHYVLTKAVITGVRQYELRSPGIYFEFFFNVGDKKITFRKSMNCKKENAEILDKMLYGKEMYAIYDNTNLDNCELILYPLEIKEYKLDLSATYDSLLKVIDSVKSL